MKLLPFEGYMIPGLHFDNCSIWVLNWKNNPTQFKKMIEVWILWYDGRKECYISPSEAEFVLRKYHSFDRIIPANINIIDIAGGIEMTVTVNEIEACTLRLKYQSSLKYRLINFMLKVGNKDKMGDKGKTETGMYYHNVPNRIIPLLIDEARLNSTKLSTVDKPEIKFSLGDGKPSDEPIINYCIHMLEE